MTTLTLDATQLRKAWPRIKKACPRNTTLPILGALTLQRVNDETVRISTNGLDLILTALIQGTADSDEPIYLWWDALDAALTKTVCELTFTTEPVEDEDKPDNIRISGGSRELTVQAAPSEDMPADSYTSLRDGEQQAMVTLTKPQCEAIKTYVLGAAAKDDSRPVLRGVHLTVGKQAVQFGAADGYRMGVYSLPTEYEGDDDIIMDRDLIELWTSVPDCAMIFEPVTFSPENSENPVLRIPIYFQAQGISYLALGVEIDGTYPDIEQIVPDEKQARGLAHISRESILDLADAARSRNDIVRIKQESVEAVTSIQGNSSTLAWTNGHVRWEQVYEDLEPDAEYAFNGQYLKWAVAGDDELPLMVQGQNSPGLVRKHVGGGELSLVVMPMTIGGN